MDPVMCSTTEVVPQLESILMNMCSFIYHPLYPYTFFLSCLHWGELPRIKGSDAVTNSNWVGTMLSNHYTRCPK